MSMSADDRLTNIEHRLAVLEDLVRRGLTAERAAPIATATQTPVLERLAQTPVAATTAPQPPSPPRAPRLSIEQWFGQRGMLGIGVLLLLLGGAYFLKVAIDRDWISPATRCIGAIVAGLAVAAVGWRTYRRGTAVFGASLIGAGAGIVYLGIWAASRWYSLVSLEMGLIGLAVITIATYAAAHQLEIEPLGFAAAVGALLGPIVIGSNDPSANALLLYLGGVGITLGAAAVHRKWRRTTMFVIWIAAVLGISAARHADPFLATAFAVTVALTALWLRRRWVESGLIGFCGGAILLLLIPRPPGAPWLVIAGGVLLAAPIWWDELRGNVGPGGGVFGSARPWSPAESFLFYLAPLVLGATVANGYQAWGAAHPGAIALIVAAPYLLVGYLPATPWQRSRAVFAFVGTTELAIAAFNWQGLGITAAAVLLGLGLLWAALDHLQQRVDGRWFALLALGFAAARFSAIVRAEDGAAFVDSWAITIWVSIVAVAALASGLWRKSDDGYQELRESVPAILWVIAGALLLGGVTNELIRLAGQRGYTPDVVRLAGGLAVSAWWAVFAGALVVFGFARRSTAVRIAGLTVAGGAVIKVLFVDLANLDQLYRVGSFIVLAVVLLLVAYLYNRQARTLRDGSDNPTNVIAS